MATPIYNPLAPIVPATGSDAATQGEALLRLERANLELQQLQANMAVQSSGLFVPMPENLPFVGA